MKNIIGTIMLCMCTSILTAQDSSSTTKKKRRLKTVSVKGETNGNFVNSQNVIKIERLDAKELKKNACCNLAESFESNASVEISSTNALSGAKQVEMLGLQGTYVQTLIELLPHVRGINYTYGFNNIPGPFVESIYINKGPGSVTNGFESMTGQIDVELIKPAQYKPLVHINGYYNNFSRSEINLNTGIRLSDELSTLFAAHGSQITKRNDVNQDGFMDIPLNNMLHLMNRWKYDGNRTESMIMAIYHNSNIHGGSMTYDFNKQNIEQNNLYGIDVQSERLDVLHKAGYAIKQDRTKSIGIQSSFSTHNTNAQYGRSNYNGYQKTFSSNLIYQTNFLGDDNELRLGGGLISDIVHEEFQTVRQNRTETIAGVYAEYTNHDIQNTTLLLGLRGDYNWRLQKGFFTPRLNVLYKVNEAFSARLSGGSGFRTPTIFAENTRFFASSRNVFIQQNLQPEQSWNYGLNLTYNFNQSNKDSRLSLDIFRTDFTSQVVVDFDRSPQEVHMYMLQGKSYGWYAQAEYYYEILPDLDLRLAYKFNEVRATQDGILRERVFNPRHRALFNLAYETRNKKWNFDFTTQWTGEQRLPDFSKNPENMRPQSGMYSPDFFRLLGQVSWKAHRDMEIYMGSENITNFRQHDLIIGANDPYGPFFDAGAAWGPAMGRLFYAGFRYTLNKTVEPILTANKIVIEKIKVNGVCGMCKDRIEKTLNKLPGIKYASWDEYLKELVVRYNHTKVTNDAIQQQVAQIGHDTEKYKASDAAYNALHACCKYRDQNIIEDHK